VLAVEVAVVADVKVSLAVLAVAALVAALVRTRHLS
jgi:hypothetical protein